jgi:hypothetical protein
MSKLIQASAGRIAAQIQSFGANFDPEILSLPGGSLIAVALWAYSSTSSTFRRARPPKAAAFCTGCTGRD